MSERQTMTSVLDKIVSALATALERARILESSSARSIFTEATGLTLSAEDGKELSQLAARLSELLDGLDRTESTRDYLKLGLAVSQLIRRIAKLPTTKPTGTAANHAIGYFLSQRWGRRHPVTALLNLSGALEYDVPDSGDESSGDVPGVYPKRLVSLFTDPEAWADDVYQWKTAFNFRQFILRLFEIARAAGCDAGLVGSLEDKTPAGEFNGGLRIPLARYGFTDGDRSELGVLVSKSAAIDPWKPGIELTLYAMGTLPPLLFETSTALIEIEAKCDLSSGICVTVAHGGPLRASFGRLSDEEVEAGSLIWRVRRDTAYQTNWITIDPLHIVSKNEVFELGISFEPTSEGVYAELSADVEGAFSPSDGFLGSILPGNTTINVPVVVRWSARQGLSLSGSPGLKSTVRIPSIPGPIAIPEVAVSFGPGSEGDIELRLAPTIVANIGPVAATIQGGGLVLRVVPMALVGGEDGGSEPLTISVDPPTAVGLAINAQAVTGSGYLSYDSDKKQYTGLLQLEIAEKISLSAVGLLTTRMPDGSNGYSLLVLLSTRFEPGIQLGYGFVLKGLGGLFGVHRTVAVEVLRDGLRRGVLDSVLFPENIIEQAPQIVSNLATIFPPAHDRYLFGPMALIEWGGSSPLVTLELGIMLEAPEPVRLVMVGRLRIFLPRKDESAPIRLQLDALGLIDFQSGNIALDAVLYDSVIGPYAVTGQMALRANFGAQPMFLLSVGGFHPAFPVPAGFPSLERVTFSLAKREGGVEVHLQMSAYLALTSNTVQFGAHLDLMARLGKFILTGQVGFDALIQLQPFGLTVSLEGAVAVKVSGTVLMGIRLQMNLTGPSPWHAWGKAKFKLLFVSVTKEFDVQIGHEEPPALPPSIDVANELMAELTNSKNWSSHLPMGESQLVTFRTQPAAIQGSTTELLPKKVLIHPFAEIQVSQRRVPLDEPITQFNNMIPQGDTQFKLTVNLGEGENNVPPSTQDVSDWFAPAQFAVMSDAEKLSAPSFKEMHSGIRFTAGKGYRCGKVSEVTPITETNASNRGIDTGLSSESLARVAAFGAAGKASIRGTGPAKYRDPSRLGHGPTLRPPGYRVVAKQGGSVPTEASLFLSYSAAQMQAIRTRIRNLYSPVAVVPDIGASK